MIAAHFQSWHLHNQKVLVRADLNVPIQNNQILSDFKLKAFEPTLHALLKQQARVIIITHLTPELSTQLLLPWFNDQGYTISFAPDIETARTMDNHSLILLENIRFFLGEKEQSADFARALAQLGTYYINDAFGVLHRSDTSVTLLPALFQSAHRSCGLLIEKELHMLTPIAQAPKHPYVGILGGGKPETKLPLMMQLLSTVDVMIVLPALSNTYADAQRQPVGQSLVCKELQDACLKTLHRYRNKIMLPLDYQVASSTPSGALKNIRTSAMNEVHDQDIIVSIGPKTIARIQNSIAHANMILLNGMPGFSAFEYTQEAAHELLKIVTQSTAQTLLCGTDSIALAEKYTLLSQFTYVSTGGGATLAYLAGNTLPSLIYLKK